MFFKLVAVLCLVGLTTCVPTLEGVGSARNSVQNEDDLLSSVYQDCLKKDTVSCLKYKVLTFTDRLLDQSSIPLTDGVQLVQTSEVTPQEKRALTSDSSLESVVIDKVKTFLETRSLKLDISGKDILNTASNTARSIGDTIDSLADEEEIEYEEVDDEGRGKGGKKKIKKIKKMFGGMGMMGMLAFKLLIIKKLILMGLAFMVAKAIVISKVALVLAGVMFFMKFFGNKGGNLFNKGGLGGGILGHESYHAGGDVGGPYPASGQTGWGRSSDAQKLAYAAYNKQD